jgi:hypothetical protein
VTSDPLTPLRVLDLALLALALPVFLIAPLPFLGWVTAAVIWLLWRGIGRWADAKAAASSDPRVVVGYETGAMIGRGWMLGLSLLGAGLLFGNDVGLSAAVLDFALFTVFFTTKLIVRPFDAAGPPKEPHTTP